MQTHSNNLNIDSHEAEADVITMREAVGVFPDDEHLLAAIDDLEMSQFGRQDFSVLGNEVDMRRTYHEPTHNPYNMQDDPAAPRGVHVAPEERSLAEASLVAAGVLFTVFLLGPVMGEELTMATNITILLVLGLIGGAIGYVAVLGLRSYRAHRTGGQIRKGGLLLWVSTPTKERENLARDILMRHGARDVHINEVAKPIA